MFGIVRPSIVLKAESLARSFYPTVNDCLKIFEGGSSVSCQDTYRSLRFTLSSPEISREAINDSRYFDLLNQVDVNIPTLNSKYLGNFAFRLHTLLNTINRSKNEEHVRKTVSILEKIGEKILEKDSDASDITKVAFSLSNAGIDNPSVYEAAKRQITLQIDNVRPDVLNTALLLGDKIGGNEKRVFTSLLLEKLSELTDRFTAEDVVFSLKALSERRLFRGFLLRRLSILVADNLDQFNPHKLSLCMEGLARCKFLSNTRFREMFNSIQPSLNAQSVGTKLKVLYSSCFAETDPNDKTMIDLLNSIQAEFQSIKALVQYIYCCAYFKQYETGLQENINRSLSKTFYTHRDFFLLKEALDTISLDTDSVKITLSDTFVDLSNSLEEVRRKWSEGSVTSKDVHKVLLDSNRNFEVFQKVGPFTVDFVDNERKECLLVDSALLETDFSLTIRSLTKLGYRAHVIKYWGWKRALRTSSQASYISELLQS